MTCINAYDTITQADGTPLDNHFDYSDTEHVVTSYCRTADGTWIAWKNIIFGDNADPDSGVPDNDTNKNDWAANIASANAIGVGFFPDDGSAPIVYELGIDPTYEWTTGFYAGRDVCALWPLLGDYYADSNKSELQAWAMGILDVQVRTDGTKVWVIALAQEAVKYPFLYNAPSEIDNCGNTHPTFEEDWASGHSDPFVHDTSSGTRWWKYGQKDAIGGGDKPFGDYDDPGPSDSFRWQPARVTVFAGDIGGFTRLDTIEAKFRNDDDATGLCSGIEAAASPAEPEVMHLLWSEGGQFGVQTVEPKVGQRINYSRWDFTGKILDTDLLYVDEDGTGFVSDANWIWTAEMIVRNDHGSPIAIVWPPDPDTPSVSASTAVEFWDLSSGAIDVLQTLDDDLVPTAAETGLGVVNQAGGVASGRSQFASSLYTDTRRADTDVYLICSRYNDGSEQAAAFYRIVCDGSATFEFLDGIRTVMYSILPAGVFLDAFGRSLFRADFVSDPDDVWMPSSVDDAATGGAVLQLDRQCARGWKLLPAFPIIDTGSGYEDGMWALGTSPPTLITDDIGDWIYGGGNGPVLTTDSSKPTNIAALKAKICRCCEPCNRTGMHVWHRI